MLRLRMRCGYITPIISNSLKDTLSYYVSHRISYLRNLRLLYHVIYRQVLVPNGPTLHIGMSDPYLESKWPRFRPQS